MAKSLFKAGVEVDIEGKELLILRKLDDSLWQLEDQRDKRIFEYGSEELRRLYATGSLVFINGHADLLMPRKPGKPHADFSEAQWEAAKVCRAYVLATMGLPCNRAKLTPIVRKTWLSLGGKGKPPSTDAVIRWRRKYVHAGQDIVGMVHRKDKRGNRVERYPQEILDIVDKAIDSEYLTEERKTVQDVIDHVHVLINDENKLRPASLQLKKPTRTLVMRLISSIPAYDRCVARHGRLIANRRFRAVLKNRITRAALERGEIDHTILDVMAIDDDSGLPLGRPYLTVCIDDYSRCILGIYIGFEPPSYLTVAHCLKHAFLPKIDLKERYPKVEGQWLAHGVMDVLVVDNGREFHSTSLENACYSLGIEIHYSARKTPWFKGKVERFLGTLNRDVAHGMPGTTFSNIFDKEEYDPVKHAVVRLSVLREIIHLWIVDVYHERVHRSLKAPPVAMWKSSIAEEDIYLPDDPARLDAIMGRSELRRLTHKGIELDCLFYNSPELTTLRRQLGDVVDVEVRVDDANIGRIYVLSPDKHRIFKVPAVNLAYADGMSAWQHKVCRRYADKELKSYSVDGWLKAKQRIADIIAGEIDHKKIKTRARQARLKDNARNSQPTNQAVPALPAPEPASALQLPGHGVLTPLPPEIGHPVADAPMPAKHFAPIVRRRSSQDDSTSNDPSAQE